MVKRSSKRTYRLLFSFALLWSLCVFARDTTEQYYEDARQRFAAGETAAALIQLKNALQQDPQHVPSLVLSGEIYLEQNDAAAAEDAFSDSLLLGADRSYIAEKLGEAYLRQRKYLEVLKDLPLEGVSGDLLVELLGYHAEAYAGLGKLDEALAAVGRANAIDAGAFLPNLAAVGIYLRQRQIASAVETASALLDKYPEDARVWTASGSVLHAQGELTEAMEYYARAISLDADSLDARLARAGILLDLEREDEALEDLDYVAAKFPREPRAAYLQALVYLRQGDSARRLEALRRCTASVGAMLADRVIVDTQLVMAVSLAHYALAEFELARSYLEQYLKRNPNDLGAGRLQGAVLLELEATNEAIKLLRPLLRLYPGDPQLMSLLASVYGQGEQYDRAIELLETLQRMGYDGSETKRRIALTRLDAGQYQRGIRELAAFYKENPTRLEAGLALTMSYLRGKQYKSAQVTARELVARDPKNLSYRNMLGLALYFDDQFDAAAGVFSDMLELEPGFVPAELNLVRVSIAQGRYAVARQRLGLLLERAPESDSVMLEQARLERLQDNLPEARRWAENAVRAKPQALEPRIFLAETYLRMGELAEAQRLANDTVNILEENLEAMAMKGQVLAKIGKAKEALMVYGRMAKVAGFDPIGLYRIALLQSELGAYQEMRHSLFKALESDPDYRQARLAYVDVHLVLGEAKEAMKLSIDAQQRYPRESIWHGFEGESALRLGKYAQGDKAFREALSLEYNRIYVLGLYRALVLQGQETEAEKLLRSQIASHSDDASLQTALAEHLLQRGRWKEGSKLLTELVQRDPSDPKLLNNLANVKLLLEENDAIDYARRAYDAAPEDSSINDTLGWILVKSNKPEEGLRYLREATTRDADNPELRFHLAMALHDVGRTSEARAELREALASESSGRWRQEAENLLQAIQ